MNKEKYVTKEKRRTYREFFQNFNYTFNTNFYEKTEWLLFKANIYFGIKCNISFWIFFSKEPCLFLIRHSYGTK